MEGLPVGCGGPGSSVIKVFSGVGQLWSLTHPEDGTISPGLKTTVLGTRNHRLFSAQRLAGENRMHNRVHNRGSNFFGRTDSIGFFWGGFPKATCCWEVLSEGLLGKTLVSPVCTHGPGACDWWSTCAAGHSPVEIRLFLTDCVALGRSGFGFLIYGNKGNHGDIITLLQEGNDEGERKKPAVWVGGQWLPKGREERTVERAQGYRSRKLASTEVTVGFYSHASSVMPLSKSLSREDIIPASSRP